LIDVKDEAALGLVSWAAVQGAAAQPIPQGSCEQAPQTDRRRGEYPMKDVQDNEQAIRVLAATPGR
jgi:hypothetical protein